MLLEALPHFLSRGVSDMLKHDGLDQAEVFHSAKSMLRKSLKVDCREESSRIGTK